MDTDMETKPTIRKQKIILADVMNTVEVMSRKELKQIKGGDSDPLDPVKK